MKNLIITTILTFVFTSAYCQNRSYDIVVNLDDRILNDNQAERDIELIKDAFREWEANVKKQFYILSNDCFRVLVTDQKSTPASVENLVSELQIDLRKVGNPQKRIEVDRFASALENRLNKLYKLAYVSDYKSDYSGANIWKYLNSMYSDEIKNSNEYHTHLIILTDGYIDFEGKQVSYNKDKKYSNTFFLSEIRTLDWKNELSTTGLLPCVIDLSNTTVSIYEITPKVAFPFELQIIKSLYDNWFKSMDAKKVITRGRTNNVSYVSNL